MFYNDNPSKILRLGDVVTGFHLASFHVNDPGNAGKPLDLNVHVTKPLYFVVMTPCCSIENQSISLAPLTQLRQKFFEFPRLVEDMTRMNVRMEPQESLPPKHWESLSADEKGKLVAKGLSFILLDCFVYEPNGLFKPYSLKKGTKSWEGIGHMMVDFRQTFRVECPQIERGNDAPDGIKMLELSIETRSKLRDKLAHFFGRIPDEDAA